MFNNRDDVVYAGRARDGATPATNTGFKAVGIVESMQLMLIPILESIDRTRSEVEIAGDLRERNELATVPLTVSAS